MLTRTPSLTTRAIEAHLGTDDMQMVCHGDAKGLPYDFQAEPEREKQTQYGPDELKPLGKSPSHFSRCQPYLRNESENSMLKAKLGLNS